MYQFPRWFKSYRDCLPCPISWIRWCKFYMSSKQKQSLRKENTLSMTQSLTSGNSSTLEYFRPFLNLKQTKAVIPWVPEIQKLFSQEISQWHTKINDRTVADFKTPARTISLYAACTNNVHRESTHFLHCSQLYMLSPFSSSAEKNADRQSRRVIVGPTKKLQSACAFW